MVLVVLDSLESQVLNPTPHKQFLLFLIMDGLLEMGWAFGSTHLTTQNLHESSWVKFHYWASPFGSAPLVTQNCKGLFFILKKKPLPKFPTH